METSMTPNLGYCTQHKMLLLAGIYSSPVSAIANTGTVQTMAIPEADVQIVEELINVTEGTLSNVNTQPTTDNSTTPIAT
jgi:hypothetical protein